MSFIGYMAKTRIRRGSRVYEYERENYRDSTGKVKHRNTRYLGIEVTINGEKQIIPPKKNKGLPVLFRTYKGNITDVKTVEQLIL
jgi:hypothetical protein